MQTMQNARSRWTTWEYLPSWAANLPVYGIYAWFALRARHPFFFSNVNPAIPLGGALGESKSDILNLIPAQYLPRWVLLAPGRTHADWLVKIQEAGLLFPLIAKPDIGERGFLIKKIADQQALFEHLETHPVPFILQEFITLPMEASVLFHGHPDGPEFDISSLCLKDFLSVTGDGNATVRELMGKDFRAQLQIDRFEKEQPKLLQSVPAKGENILLEPIGNHIRGTKFINGNHLIDQALREAFRPVWEKLEGIFFGRFDLKCASLEALRRGEFTVMEMNGVFSEPAHVYDPANRISDIYRDYYRHWRSMYQISKAQKQRGVKPATLQEGMNIVRQYLSYKKQLNGA